MRFFDEYIYTYLSTPVQLITQEKLYPAELFSSPFLASAEDQHFLASVSLFDIIPFYPISILPAG